MTFARIYIQVWSSRPEIPHLTAHAERMCDPHIQAKAHLKDTGGGAFAGIGPTEFQMIRHSEMPDATTETELPDR